MGYPDPSPAYRNDLSQFHCLVMELNEFIHQRDATLSGNVGEADQSRMPNALQIDKLPKVSIESDQYSVFGFRAFEQRLVARVGTERTRFENVMPLFPQPNREPSAGAPIDEDPHDSATVTADRVSLAMTACA